MILLLASIFVAMVVIFGVFLSFARPENIERPFLVGVLTTVTSLAAAGLLWTEWQQGGAGHAGTAVAYSLFAASGFALGRAVDTILGPRTMSADERQATLGAELAD